MLTNAKIRQYRALKQKKYREMYGQFMIQGRKIVSEALSIGLEPDCLIANNSIITSFPEWKKLPFFEHADDKQLSQISSLKTAPDVIAVMPVRKPTINRQKCLQNLSIGLDCIQDPGNLGAIIRIADWFGISDIFCSKDTVDCYNPKVVQASMGALFRVNVHYVDLPDFIEEMKTIINYPVYGTFMDGRSVYDAGISPTGLLLMGNEGQGISDELEAYCTQRISIPPYPQDRKDMESLNISVATGIFCAVFRQKC
ncbi:MAG: RNA methyltransferase [Bacteroidota bacterium]